MAVNIGTVEGVLRLRDEFTSRLDAAASQLEKHGKRMDRVGRQMSDVGSKLTATISLPLAAVGGAAIKMASDFETSFAGIRKTVNATEQQFAQLARGMKDLSKEVPVNVNELNKIGEAAGQLGIKTENILSFTKTVAALGVTTNLSADEAATSLARLANITGLPQTQFDRLGSTIVALGNNFATTEAEIVSFGLRIAGAGKIAGLTEAQILGIGAAMSSVGVEAEAGGTAVQKVLLGMVQAVASGGKDLEVFARTAGMSADQFATAFRDDAGAAFTDFVEGLGQQGDAAFKTLEALNLTDQRLIRSFLSLAGAGDLLERSMAEGTKAFAENTALAREAEQRYETFASQVTILWNQVRVAAIELGTSLLPILRDLISVMTPVVKVMEDVATRFASLPKGIRASVLALAALVASIGPALFITGQLVGAWGQLVMFAPRVAGAVSLVSSRFAAMAVAGGPLALVALALLGLNELFKFAADRAEQEMARIKKAADEVGTAFDRMRQAIRTGTITVEERRKADADLLKAQERQRELTAELNKLTRNGAVATRDLHGAEEKRATKLEKLIRAEEQNEKVARRTIAAGKELIDTVEELNDELDPPPSFVPDGASDRIKDIREQLERTVRELRALAAARGSDEFKIIAAAIAAGIDPTRELTTEFKGLLAEIAKLEEDSDKFAQGIRDRITVINNEIESIKAAAQALDDVLGGRAGGDILPPVSILLDDETIERQLRSQRDLTKEIEQIWKNMIEGVQRSFVTFFEEGIRGVVDLFEGGTFEIKDLFESLWRSVVDLAIRAAAQAAAAWAAQKFAVNFTDGATGGGMSWMSLLKGAKGLFGGGGSALSTGIYGPTASGGNIAATSSGGGMAAVGIAFAAFFAAVEINRAKRRHGYSNLGEFSVTQGSRGRRPMGEGANEIFDSIESVLDAVEELTRGVVADLPELALRVRRDGEGVRVYVADQFLGWFKTMEEALDNGLRMALQGANLEGVAPEIEAALRAPAESLEALMSRLASVQEVLDWDLSPLQGEIRGTLREIDAARAMFEELGLSTNRFVQHEATAWQQWSDTVTGRKKTHEEELEIRRQEGRMFNAERALRLANLRAEVAAFDADKSLARHGADLDRNRILTETTMLGFEGEMLRAREGLFAAERQMAAGHVQSMGAILTAGGAVINERLQAILNLIAAIEAIPEIDISKITLGGGGRGQRRGDRDQLRGILDAFNLSLLGDTAQALAAINARRAEGLELAHGDAALIERVNDMRARELDLLRQTLREQVEPFLPGLTTVGPDGQSTSTGEWGQRAQEIIDWADRIAEENELLLRETGTAALETWEIIAAEANRMRELVAEAIGSLGLPLEATREQFATLNETLNFLEQQVAAGTLSAERYAEVIAQVADQQFLALGDALMGFLDRYYGEVEGFEAIRRQLEETRFHLELANLRLQFELVRDLGILTAETIEMIQGTFDWIDSNMPDFDALVNRASNVTRIDSHPRFGGSATDPFAEQNRARDLLDRYILDAMDSLSRAKHQLDRDFDFIRLQLGNTAEVQAQYAAALERIMRQHLEGIERLQQSLFLGDASPLNARQQLDTARSAFDQAVSRFRAGDLSVIADIPGIVQQYLAAARDFFPAGSAAYAGIFELVNRFLNEVLAVGNLPGMEVPGAAPGAAPGVGAGGRPALGSSFAPPVPTPGHSGDSAAGLQVARDSNRELGRIERGVAAMVREQRLTRQEIRSHQLAEVA